MNKIYFERASGSGEDALYKLFIDGKQIRAELTIDDVVRYIGTAYKEEEKADGRTADVC